MQTGHYRILLLMVEKGLFYVTIQTANGEDDIHNW